jgi:hypothetical protein
VSNYYLVILEGSDWPTAKGSDELDSMVIWCGHQPDVQRIMHSLGSDPDDLDEYEEEEEEEEEEARS